MAGRSGNADDAEMSVPRNNEDAPPAYEDLSRPPSTTFGDISRPPSSLFSGASLPDYTSAYIKAPSSSRPFPVCFNLYSINSWRAWTTRRFHLGEHADQPTNAVIFTTGWKGSNMSLHQGPDKDSPAIALGTRESTWSKNATITLPGHTSANGDPLRSQLQTHIAWNSGTVTYAFTIEVLGQDDKPHEEKFEWRLSHGKEVQDIDKGSWGYKLVRIGRLEPGSNGGVAQPGSSRDARQHGTTSDGKEVVAVWADRVKATRNKCAKFAFVGSGATGQLGEKWSVMAVATFVRVWQSIHAELSGGA